MWCSVVWCHRNTPVHLKLKNDNKEIMKNSKIKINISIKIFSIFKLHNFSTVINSLIIITFMRILLSSAVASLCDAIKIDKRRFF